MGREVHIGMGRTHNTNLVFPQTEVGTKRGASKFHKRLENFEMDQRQKSTRCAAFSSGGTKNIATLVRR